MKIFKYLLFFLILILVLEGFGQDFEKQPSFPGGEKQLYCFIDQNLNKEIFKSVDTTGVIYISFVIDTVGKPTDFNIRRSLHPTLDNEVMRVLKMMPNWTPGKQNNKPVPVSFNFPLRIPYVNKFCN
ncbi:MAG: energy transducer TonB [Bacteroidota bacterium]